MANVLHRTSKAFLKSVHTPDYDSGTYAINPAGTAALEAASVPTKYWKLTGAHPSETASEMNAAEKAAVDDDPTTLAALKVVRLAEIDSVTQDIIAEGFLHDSKIFGLATVDVSNFDNWREKTRQGADTYAKLWVLKDGTSYSIASRAVFLQIYSTCVEAHEAAYTGSLTLRSDIADAVDDAAVDAVVDGRTVEKYTPGGTPARGPFVLTGFQDLTAGTPVNLNITGAKDSSRIARARFWISANGADVGANVATMIQLKFFNTDGFLHAEFGTNGKETLLDDFGERQFISQDIKVNSNNGDGSIDIDDTEEFGIDDLIRIHDGANFEFQRVKAKLDADTLDLYDTILRADGDPVWSVGDDVTRVWELRDIALRDEDNTDEIHLRMIPRSGDSNCRLHYWIEYEGAA